MDELISVIVPIYNVEKYLEKCVKSIQEQTYKNIEIILVDDGSLDNCGELCEKYALKDPRIKVVHKENGGLSDARNKGIDNATGKYIVFVDSDDYIEINYIELLYKAIRENKAEISQCGIYKVDCNYNIIEKISYNETSSKSGKQMISETYKNKEHLLENVVVWNKMYKKELFDKIKFPFGKIHEDEFTTYKIFYQVEEVAVIPECLYNYRQTNSSITGKKYNLKRLNLLEALEERMEFFKKNNEKKLYDLTLKYYLEQSRECYIKLKLYVENSKKEQKEIHKKYQKRDLELLHSKDILLLVKIKSILFYLCPNVFYIIKKKEY